MRAYSLDIRERIVGCWQEGESKTSIAERFKVSLSSVKRYVKRFETYGHILPTVQGRMQGKITRKLRKRLAKQVEKYPDHTLAQHAQLWYEKYRKYVSESCLSRTFRRMGLTRKKKTLGAIERDEEARRIFREFIKKLEAEKIVVVDESGSRIGMIPLYGRSPRGSRVYDQVIRNYGKNLTLLASMKLDGMQAAMTVEGAVDGATFEAFVRRVLLPTLLPGQIVLMDNLSSHKTLTIECLIEQAGCQLIFLPAYSPDLSPIEEAFSKLKAFLRRCRCQSIPDLIKAITKGLGEIAASDVRGWFAHAGFCV